MGPMVRHSYGSMRRMDPAWTPHGPIGIIAWTSREPLGYHHMDPTWTGKGHMGPMVRHSYGSMRRMDLAWTRRESITWTQHGPRPFGRSHDWSI